MYAQTRSAAMMMVALTVATIRGWLVLCFARRSNDHGPFNSWDRQPYVYRLDEDDMVGSELAISPQTQTIANNLVFNFNFHGQSCGSIAIDFDDETSQMNVTENVLVYGAIKTFDGMDRCGRLRHYWLRHRVHT